MAEQTKDGNPVRKKDVKCPACKQVVKRYAKNPGIYSRHRIDPSPGMPFCTNSLKLI